MTHSCALFLFSLYESIYLSIRFQLVQILITLKPHGFFFKLCIRACMHINIVLSLTCLTAFLMDDAPVFRDAMVYEH